MSLILGIYSKKEKINKKEIEKILEDFSLNKKRKLQIKFNDKIFLSLAKFWNNDNNIVENEDKSLVILFGGEVYDFNRKVNALIKKGHKFKNRKNCAEFILHSYEEFGESFLKNVNGTFSFAIYNKLEDELILGNDSFGLYPLFIYNTHKYCIFSSEYEPITKYKKFNKELNYDAIAEYFTLGLPLGGKTFFKSINNLAPGSLLKIKKNQINLKQYDDLNIKIDKNKNLNYFATEIAKILKKAVQIRIRNLKNLVCSLSGGADTRLILSNLSRNQRKLIQFYTYKNPYLNENKDADIIITKILAKKLNLKHKIPAIQIKKDFKIPFFERIYKKDFEISFFEKKRNRPSKKVLGGLYGGEFLGGICFDICPIKIKKINKKKIEQKFKKIFNKQFQKKITNHPYISLKKEFKKIKAENKEFLFNIHQITRGFFTNIYGGSSGHLDPYTFPTKRDTIFWDKNFLKILLTVPKKYLINYKLYNKIYKNHYPELIKIPTNSPLALRSSGFIRLIIKLAYRVPFIAGLDCRIDSKNIFKAKIAHRTGSCMLFMTKGTDFGLVRGLEYPKILKVYMKSDYTWDKKFYNLEYIKSMSKEENHPVIGSFIDFEAWYREFIL